MFSNKKGKRYDMQGEKEGELYRDSPPGIGKNKIQEKRTLIV